MTSLAPRHTGWSSRHECVGGSHNFTIFLTNYKTTHCMPYLACSISLEALCYRITSAFGRLLWVYQTQCSCTADNSGRSFPGIKDGRYWWVSRDTVPEYVLFHQQHIRQYKREFHGSGDAVSEKDCSFVDGGEQTSMFRRCLFAKFCCVLSDFWVGQQ
jgi:hypothetical protein